MHKRIHTVTLEVDRKVVGKPLVSALLEASFGPPAANHPLVVRRPHRKTPLDTPQRRSTGRILATRVADIRRVLLDGRARFAQILSRSIGTTVELPGASCNPFHFPGTPYHARIACPVTQALTVNGDPVLPLLTETTLGQFENELLDATKVAWVSVRLILNHEQELYPFELTPELIEMTRSKLQDVLAEGNYGELVHQQWSIINSMLSKSMRRRGPEVTKAEIEGIMEMATVHLWSPAWTFAAKVVALQDELKKLAGGK